MTKAFLIVSVACNVWFLFLLFYDRIMDTKLIRFFRHIAGLWRSLDSTVAEQGKDKEIPHADTSDIIGKSRFKMASTRTTAAIPTQEAATSEKGIELSEEEATFDDGNTETVSRPTQVPEDKLDETFITRITERLTDEAMSERLAKAMAVFVDTVNMTVTQQKEKVFVIPDNIEEFDFRNYV